MSQRLFIPAFLALALSATAQLPAIPEPPLMLLGTVTDASTNQPVTARRGTRQLRSAAKAAEGDSDEHALAASPGGHLNT